MNKIENDKKFVKTALDVIYNGSSKDYQSKVGKYEMGDNLTTFGAPIIKYTSVMNEFINSLIQLVAFPIFQSHMWDNRLKILKKGNKPFGFDIEDIYTNPVNPTPYKYDDFSRIMKGTKQDTISAVYRENRHDVFQKTITKDMLRGAFNNETAFVEFIDTLVKSIYAGNEIEEFNLTKRSINECFEASMFKTQSIDFKSQSGIEECLIAVKNAYDYFQFPSSNYNNYDVFSGTGTKAKVWTRPEDIIVIADVNTINSIKVKYLAGIFNLSEVEFRERLILVDDFGWDEYEVDTDGVTGKFKQHHDSPIKMVIADSGAFQIYDTIEASTEFFNAGNLATNYFLHIWQTYGIRPWANFLVFTDGSTTATKVTPMSANLDTRNQSVDFQFTTDNNDHIFVDKNKLIVTTMDTNTNNAVTDNSFYELTITDTGAVNIKYISSVPSATSYLMSVTYDKITAFVNYNSF